MKWLPWLKVGPAHCAALILPMFKKHELVTEHESMTDITTLALPDALTG